MDELAVLVAAQAGLLTLALVVLGKQAVTMAVLQLEAETIPVVVVAAALVALVEMLQKIFLELVDRLAAQALPDRP
jgi:hypothetical protein